jgi:hypothetical protein
MDFQVISDETGRVLAVLAYATLTLGQQVAAQYSRVLGVRTYRNTMRCLLAPRVGSRLPELVREVTT